MRYPQPAALRYEHSIAAAVGEDTPTDPQGPLVLPGTYQLRLTVAGHTYTAPLEVKMDPRVKAEPATLSRQLALALKIQDALARSYDAARQARDLRRQLGEYQTRAGVRDDRELAGALRALDQKAAALAGGQTPQETTPTLTRLNGSLASLMTAVGGADAAPTEQASAAFDAYRQLLDRQLEAWAALKDKDLTALNALLRRRQLPSITVR